MIDQLATFFPVGIVGVRALQTFFSLYRGLNVCNRSRRIVFCDDVQKVDEYLGNNSCVEGAIKNMRYTQLLFKDNVEHTFYQDLCCDNREGI